MVRRTAVFRPEKEKSQRGFPASDGEIETALPALTGRLMVFAPGLAGPTCARIYQKPPQQHHQRFAHKADIGRYPQQAKWQCPPDTNNNNREKQ